MGGTERLLAEKLRLARGLLAEAERESAFIAGGDLDGLSKSIDDRQALLDEMIALAKKIGDGPPAGPAESKLKGEIDGVLAEILRRDDENRRRATDKLGELVSGIKESNAAKTLKAYQRPPGAGFRYVNKKG
jgi:hypothetical protein